MKDGLAGPKLPGSRQSKPAACLRPKCPIANRPRSGLPSAAHRQLGLYFISLTAGCQRFLRFALRPGEIFLKCRAVQLHILMSPRSGSPCLRLGVIYL
jgi:hypothetical protein